ncbi:MAG: outer membrane lipoprotein-sorting protein [Candidatus Muiribacteriota bacterium]
MKKTLFIVMLIISILFVYGEQITVEEILDKIDFNMTPESLKYEGEMIISRPGREMVKKFTSYGVGTNKSYMEFTYPPRDRGTKYLRIDNDLWMYLPGASRTVKISGHMLRQSMMGSDFSYEDQTENQGLKDQYEAKILNEEIYEDKAVYVIELRAKEGIDPVYFMQKIWVDKEKFIYYKAELFGRSEKLLKEMFFYEYTKINEKYYPKKMKIEDNLKTDSYTEIIMHNLELDINIPASVFTLQNLERK